MDELGADILRLWVASHRLLGRAVDLERDPEARGRVVPPHPQHAALPARQPRRLRSRARRAAGRRAGSRSTAMPGDDARPAAALTPSSTARGSARRALRRLRVPPGGAEAADVLLGGPRRLLPRHPEGSALHHARPIRAPRRAAQNALYHITQSADAPARADPVVHRAGGLGGAERATRRACSSRRGTSSRCRADADALRERWSTLRALRSDVSEAARRRCASRGKIGSSLAGEVELYANGAEPRIPALVRRRPALRVHHLAGARARRQARTDGRHGAAGVKLQRDAEPAPEVRALLALPRRRRRGRGAPGDLRALRVRICTAPGEPRDACLSGSLARARGADRRRSTSSRRCRCRAQFALHESVEITPFFNLVLVYNRGAAFSFLADAAGWQRGFFIAHRARRLGLDRLAAARHPRRDAVLPRAEPDPRRRARQRDRPRALSARWSIFSISTRSASTGRLSTSPTPRSAAARCCSSGTRMRPKADRSTA